MPADSRWKQLDALFEGALSRSESERPAWLREKCPDDAALRSEVERMLEAHRQGGGILDQSPRVARPPAELLSRVERALSDRYAVERELGRGGTATVYLARERKHERRVVIKVLNPEIAAWWGPDRFMREVQIAARLSHPNVVGLIDSGEADGLLFYVMPYVEGQTLREWMMARGLVPVPVALSLLLDIADALVHAHAAGVIHRDLKPENVLCAGNHAFLLDFGVAKLVSRVAGQVQLTRSGMAVGTPAYMAPEQVTSAGDVDHRADIFAWGLLAHEMLTGRLPAAAAQEGGEDVSALRRRSDVPTLLIELVEQCLAPVAAGRVESAEALVARLSTIMTPMGFQPSRTGATRWNRAGRLATGVIIAGAMILIASVIRGRFSAAPAPAFAVPVAVAALTNETGDESLASWGRMAGDWMTQGLQQTGLVSVVPWPLVLKATERIRAGHASGEQVDPISMIRAETGAATVVTGSFYRVGDSLQFRVEVTDARTGRLLGAPPPVAAPVDSAHQAVRMLRDRLMSAVAIWSDERFARLPDLARQPPTFAAYQAFDRGIQRYVSQEYGAAAPDFRQAYALDTTFLVPLIYATSAYWNRGEFGRADSIVQTLRARYGELSEYHRSWSEHLEALLAGDGERALSAIRRAASVAPGSKAWYNLAYVALETDRPREALDALTRLDPDRGAMRGWSSYWTQLTHALHLLSQHDRELEAARSLGERYPDREVALVLQARALAAAGRLASLDSLMAGASARPPTTYWSQGAAMVVAGEELVAHGRPAAGRAWLQRGADWLRAQLAIDPRYRAHRYWLGSALYDLGAWREAHEYFDGLATEYPDELNFRGLAALASAHLGEAAAERRLGEVRSYERGDHTAFRARLAAIRGDQARAVSLFADAIRMGVDGLPWLHSSAHVDLAALAGVRGSLPVSLR